MFRTSRLLTALLTAGICSATANAADPVFSKFAPVAGQQGQTVTVTVIGNRLADIAELMTDEKGIEVLNIKPDEKQADRRFTAELKIAADAPLGLHRFKVRTETGLSNEVCNFCVTALPTVAEKENNSSFEEAEKVEQNIALVGRVDREDVDYFSIDAKKGQRLSVEVVGMRFGYSSGDRYFDPYVAILDKDRFEIAANDDHPLTKNDPFLSVTIPEDGQYTIEVRDTAYNGDGNAEYVCHLGDFPRPDTVVPPGGRPGESLTVTFLGDPAGPQTREITLPSTPGQFEYYYADDKGVAPTPNLLKVEDLPITLDVEPKRDVYTEATPAPVPGAFTGVLAEEDDYDSFVFEAKKGEQYRVTTLARTLRSPVDPVTQAFDVKNRKYLAGSDDIGNNPDGSFDLNIPEDGQYAIRIYDHLHHHGPEMIYRLEVTRREPEVSGQVVEFQRYVQPQWAVPAGGAIGRRIAVSRRNFGGEVVVQPENLPPGVRVEMPEVWGSSGQLPLVLFADPNAELAGSFATMKLNHENGKAVGPIVYDALLTRYRNNDRVIEEHYDTQPVAVTKATPYRVTIDEPKLPAVPGAWTDLTVRCERDEGFEGEVRIEMLLDPPGCSSSRSIRFKKEESQHTFRVTAGDNAGIGRWDVCMRAYSDVGGTLESCSPFVPLIVANRTIDLNFEQAAGELGTTIPIVVKATHNSEYAEPAQVTLHGLPPKCTAEPQWLKPGQEEIVFNVTVAEDAPVGTHKSIYCIAEVPYGTREPATPAGEQLALAETPKAEDGPEATKPAPDEQEPKEGEKPEEAKPEDAKPAEGEAPAEEAKPEPQPEPLPTVPHQFRGGKLRIDKPLPPKADAPAPKPEEKKSEPPQKKPLSRLEQLRAAKGM